MSYKKRTNSDAYDKLSLRLEAMRTIDPNFDMGQGLTADNLDQLVTDLQAGLNGYNATLMDADDQRTSVMDLEKQALDAAERLLASTMVQYGRDSMQYRRVGGIMKSEIIPTGSRPLTYQPAVDNGSGSST